MSLTWKKFGLFLIKIFWWHFTKKTPPTIKGNHQS